MQESQKEVSNIIAKIDAFGAGMREANQKISNTFRTFADKEEVDYSQKDMKFSKTDMVKKPWLAKQKILKGMEVRLDAAIEKIKNLSRDVEINQMMKIYNELMNQPDEISAVAMVAELEYRYGSDAFEPCEQIGSTIEKVPDVEAFDFKKDGKSG